MDYFCEECDMIIREEDVTIEEEASEAWGHIVYERWVLCPKCGETVGRNYEDEEEKEVWETYFRRG